MHSTQRLTWIACAVIGLTALTSPLFGLDYLRVSVKHILDAQGNRSTGDFNSDATVVSAFEDANVILENNGASFRIHLDEILEVSGASQYFNTNSSEQDAMQALLQSSSTLGWRTDAINIYAVNSMDLGGSCAFPRSHELILMNNQGPLGGNIAWLHEIGHYLSLTHTFESCQLGVPSNPAICTGAAAAHTGMCNAVDNCPDTCSLPNNLMSFSLFSVENITLSVCQQSHMEFELHDPGGTRSAILLFDDAFETNDDCASAAFLAEGSYPGLLALDKAEDWYRIVVPTGETVQVALAFTHAAGDIDVSLHSGCGGPTVASGASATDDELISYTNSGPSAEFFLRVYLPNDPTGEYALTNTISGTLIDCNGNEIPDDFDISSGLSADCDVDGLPDECDAMIGDENFVRGDANGSGTVELGDAISILSYLFSEGPALCLDAHDVDDSGIVQINDPIFVLNYLFESGPLPALPGLTCGADATPDPHECCVYSGCTP